MQSKERGAEGEDAERRTRADEKSVQRSLQLVIRVQSRTDCWGGEEREKESRVQGDGQSGERHEEGQKEGRKRGRKEAEEGTNATFQIDRADPSNLPIKTAHSQNKNSSNCIKQK